MAMIDVAKRGNRRAGAGATVPPPALVLLSIVSVQLGAALTKGLFATVGPAGAVFLRTACGALLLVALWRPPVRGQARADLATVLAFGLVLAGMSLTFYAALDRLPLGAAVTLSFMGPLGVALLGSRRPLDLLWGGLALSGVLLIGPLGEGLDPRGVALALLAGSLWGAYIPLSARTGRAFPGASGLALAMGVAAVLAAPFGLAAGGAGLLDPRALLCGLGVALLSSVLPFTLEMTALRCMPARTFGILLSLEPAVGAIVGALALREGLSSRAVLAVGLVVLASVGSTVGARRPSPAALSPS
ncbi:MAG: EamA family transporter [Thermomicrobiales bacterium]